MNREAPIERAVSSGSQIEASATHPASVGPEPILCSQAEAWKMLAIGKTLGAALLSSGELQSVRIGSRRLVKIASVRLLAERGK